MEVRYQGWGPKPPFSWQMHSEPWSMQRSSPCFTFLPSNWRRQSSRGAWSWGYLAMRVRKGVPTRHRPISTAANPSLAQNFMPRHSLPSSPLPTVTSSSSSPTLTHSRPPAVFRCHRRQPSRSSSTTTSVPGDSSCVQVLSAARQKGRWGRRGRAVVKACRRAAVAGRRSRSRRLRRGRRAWSSRWAGRASSRGWTEGRWPREGICEKEGRSSAFRTNSDGMQYYGPWQMIRSLNACDSQCTSSIDQHYYSQNKINRRIVLHPTGNINAVGNAIKAGGRLTIRSGVVIFFDLMVKNMLAICVKESSKSWALHCG